MLLDKMVIDSATTSVDENRTSKDYSEWRLFPRGIRSRYHYVTVNEGFQNKDFQTRGTRGGGSIIDPEILGKLRYEASAIDNQSVRRLVLSVSFFVICMGLGLNVMTLLEDRLSVGVFIAIPSIGYPSLFVYCLVYIFSQKKKDDDKMTALLESYQPIFLQNFGVEFGRASFDIGFDEPTAGFYFRRPRQTKAEAAAAVDKENSHEKDDLRKEDEEDGYLPAIYIHRLIPGEISVEDKEYDAASMKGVVDAETWALLQSTHERRMLRSHLMMTFILLTLVYLLCFLVGVHVMSFSGNVTVSIMVILGLCFEFVVLFCFFFPWYLEYYYYPRFYKKVTTMVNEVLQQQQQQQQDEEETTPFLSLEFHDSEVPGREGILGRRYQFVVRRRQQEEGALSTLQFPCAQEMV